MALDQRGALAEGVRHLLWHLGYDVEDDPHFKRSPERVAEWLTQFAMNGDDSHVAELLGVVFPESTPQDLVLVGPTEYRSMCAHHLLPVTGVAWVGYLPENGICGLSKLTRLVEFYANQLTVQERVTAQIADALDTHLKPRGAMVIVRAVHSCMTFRGVRDRDVSATTSAVRGVFKESAAARSEFLSLAKGL